MKKLYVLTLLIVSVVFCNAQSEAYRGSKRSSLNPLMAPFYHGVASGDPLTDRVIIWTRITLTPTVDPVNVNWEMATDTSFQNIVGNGTAATDSAKDYTIKVDVTGLQPNTWYYYHFIYDTLKSVMGRTKTLPTGSVNNLRFAVASCQDYQKGFYNAHRYMSQANDIDAVLFLGDYTYENGLDSVIEGRYHEPTHKTIQLLEYRIRQSLYHLDPDLQEAHRQYPWICVWDDHETANNSYTDGAKNHNPVSDGPWYDRKSNGVEAYKEWMPVRVPDPADTFKIFRQFTFGDLVDLNMLDTRLFDRDKQAGASILSINDSTLNDSTRNMMGPLQHSWLDNNLDTSHAKWQILGQQVMMAPLVVPAGTFGPDPVIVNPDQWDGYPFDRKKLYDHIVNNNIKNVVVLSGDIHTSWANDLPLANYDSSHRSNSAGVEFVCTSISSSNELPPLINEQTIMDLAQYVRYVNLSLHGYILLDVTSQRVQGDFINVSNVLTKTYTVSRNPSWYVNDGERFLRRASSVSTPLNSYPVLAPSNLPATGIGSIHSTIVPISIHPNPFYDAVMLQFNAERAEDVNLEIVNSVGQLMFSKSLGIVNEGLNHVEFDGSTFPTGYYVVRLKGKTSVSASTVIKIN